MKNNTDAAWRSTSDSYLRGLIQLLDASGSGDAGWGYQGSPIDLRVEPT